MLSSRSQQQTGLGLSAPALICIVVVAHIESIQQRQRIQ
jgi:hypothetical protein